MQKLIALDSKPAVDRAWIMANLAQLTSESKPSQELLNSVSEWPRVYSCSFIEPGGISYEDCGLGKCYVGKEALDKMAASWIGKPVVNAADHIDGMKPQDFEPMAGGVITRVWWNPEDGWYWCDFIVWDDGLRRDIKAGYSVSCAYVPTEVDNAGITHNNIKYDQEIKNGEGTHLAIVSNPRYNDARILLNSIQGGSMKFKAWLRKLGADFKNALVPDGSAMEVDGAKVPMQDIVSAYEDEQAEAAAKQKAEEEAKLSAATGEAMKVEPKEEELGEESTLDIGGKKVTIKDALNCYRNRMARKNAADKEVADKAAKEKADKEAAEKAEADKKNAADKEAADKAAAEKAASEKAEQERKNSLAEATKKEEAEKLARFNELKNAAEQRNDSVTAPSVVEDRRAAGKSLYGSKGR